MQNLKQRWEIGGLYHFRHPRGYWEADVRVLGYGTTKEEEPWFDLAVFSYVEVEFLTPVIRTAFKGQKTIKLNRDFAWEYQAIDINLENK